MKIKKIKVTDELAPTYDLEVDVTHNYLIKCGDTNLVSHNSSVISGSTSGLEPIRDSKISKGSGAGRSIVLAPEYNKYQEFYTLAFDMKSNTPLIKVYGGIKKWACMGISANTYVNVKHYDNSQPPLSVIVSDIEEAHKAGLPTMYYNNTEDGSHSEQQEDCAGGACKL